MTKIGSAPTEKQYNDALCKLRESTIYKTKDNVQNYVEKTWVPCSFRRWCHAFRKSQALNIVRTQDKVAGLRDVSYLVEDVNALQEAITIVDDLQAKLRACCPKAEGLFLRGSPEKKKLKITKPEYHKVFHKGLSLRKKRKSKAASRSANMINVAEKVTDNKVGYIPGTKY